MSGSLRGHAAEPRSIDLNADLGEGFTNDRALLELVTSASICCGAHAGSPAAIRETLRDAAARGVCIGAHPGYPDRENFGRREQRLTVRRGERSRPISGSSALLPGGRGQGRGAPSQAAWGLVQPGTARD